jgi:hypothetical protein
MRFQSLDLGAGECDGPRALTRRRLVPACIRPHHPGGNILGGNQPGLSTTYQDYFRQGFGKIASTSPTVGLK